MVEEKKPEEEIIGPGDKIPAGLQNSIWDSIGKYRLYIGVGFGVVVTVIVALVLFSDGNGRVAIQKSSRGIERHDDGPKPRPEQGEIKNGREGARKTEFGQDNKKSDPEEPTLEEAIYEWTPEELMELARLKSMPPNSTPKDSENVIDIDTAAIMKELEEIFAQPDIDESILNMRPQDSIDTLNWIEKEMAALIRERQQLEQQKKELEKKENRANQALMKVGKIESQRIINLARLYDDMKPAEVARLFMNLDDSVVMQILPRMKTGNASKILALMPPKRAARISSQMITIMEK